MKMIFKLIILSVALARTGFILPGVKEITRKNVYFFNQFGNVQNVYSIHIKKQTAYLSPQTTEHKKTRLRQEIHVLAWDKVKMGNEISTSS
jgi:hypothetical protein